MFLVLQCDTTGGCSRHYELTGIDYCTILDNEILPTLRLFYGMGPSYFQDDNSSFHVSEATMTWYAKNNVRRLDWLAQSPDLNRTEQLWEKIRQANEVSGDVAKFNCPTE